MKLFLSSESEGMELNESLTKIFNEFDKKLSFICAENGKDYGKEFKTIGIIPIIVSENMKKNIKERRLIKRREMEADIRLYVNYKDFKNGDFLKKRELYIKAIMESINCIIQNSTGDFNGEKLKSDILKALDNKY